MSYLNSQRPLDSLEVDLGEGPVTVYWRKASLHDADAIEQAARRGNAAVTLEAFFMRARTEAGVRMFPDSTREESIERISKEYDMDEVVRAVNAMSKKKAKNKKTVKS